MKSFKKMFSLKLNHTSDMCYLMAENNSTLDAINIWIRADSYIKEDGQVSTKSYRKLISSVKSNECATVDEFKMPKNIYHKSIFTVTAIAKNSWVRFVFRNKKVSKDNDSWDIHCVEKDSIPIKKLIRVLCKDEYLLERPYKKSQFAALIRKKPFTELALEELYELVDHYHFGDGLYDNRKPEMIEYLREVHGITLEKSEKNEIMISQCLAGQDYFNLTKEEMAVHYMKLQRRCIL